MFVSFISPTDWAALLKVQTAGDRRESGSQTTSVSKIPINELKSMVCTDD
jgi:hypothetical protein